MKKILNNKAFKIVFSIIKTIILIIVLAMLALVLVQRLSNNNLSIGGYQMFTIISESMLPEYKIGDVVISKQVKPEEIKIDDDLVYMGKEDSFKDKIVTHRVINVYNKEGNYSYQTKGINNELSDPLVKEDQIMGKVIYKTVFLSFIGEIMSNIVGYYILFTLIAILISLQLTNIIISKREAE